MSDTRPNDNPASSPPVHIQVNSDDSHLDEFMDDGPCVTSSNTLRPTTVPAPARNRRQKAIYPQPTFCLFFSTSHIDNMDRTRELWRRRLELAKALFTSDGTRRRITSARAAELAHKAEWIRKMAYVEHIEWGLPSEQEQLGFLMELQAAEEARERDREIGGGLRVREDEDEEGRSEDEEEEDEEECVDYYGHPVGYYHFVEDEAGGSQANGYYHYDDDDDEANQDGGYWHYDKGHYDKDGVGSHGGYFGHELGYARAFGDEESDIDQAKGQSSPGAAGYDDEGEDCQIRFDYGHAETGMSFGRDGEAMGYF